MRAEISTRSSGRTATLEPFETVVRKTPVADAESGAIIRIALLIIARRVQERAHSLKT